MTRMPKVAGALLAVLVVATVVVPIASPSDPVAIGDVFAARLLPPFAHDAAGHFHLLGTDSFGRDLFTRMMLAGRLSVAIGAASALLAVLVGSALGAVAAWRGGIIDLAAMALTDALLSIPRLVLLLLCAALWRPSGGMVVVVLVATGWMGVARLVRGEVLGVRQRQFVEAADALGARSRRVLWRHVMPNALGPAIVALTLGIGNAILLESGLSFLGLGVQPPRPSWGNMIAGGRDVIVVAPWVAIAPGLALIVTVVACTLLGDALRDRLAGEQIVMGRTLAERG
jgi:peptide/nickel transport system permease protein